ncbi:Presenilin-like protein [Zootermopsis nevadensis]|uniref:Presenilin-like protein n=1 Tax=Zootermopsis nevadensis TaxID=136037 RepID=A0A067R3X1_ZOONE|nr:Presenilin-like protein [Zootermopsis nevadensis]
MNKNLLVIPLVLLLPLILLLLDAPAFPIPDADADSESGFSREWVSNHEANAARRQGEVREASSGHVSDYRTFPQQQGHEQQVEVEERGVKLGLGDFIFWLARHHPMVTGILLSPALLPSLLKVLKAGTIIATDIREEHITAMVKHGCIMMSLLHVYKTTVLLCRPLNGRWLGSCGKSKQLDNC